MVVDCTRITRCGGIDHRILPSPMERRQGERRMAALKLGMKVRILSVDKWVKERRRAVVSVPDWTDKKPRQTSLWRVPVNRALGVTSRGEELGLVIGRV